MKITVNYTRHVTLIMFTISGMGLSACAPLPQLPLQVPQAYPIQPQTQQHRQQAVHIPRAAALQSGRGVAPVRPAANQNQVQQRPLQQARVVPTARAPARAAQAPRTTQAQVMVPPVLKPAQQQARRQALNRQVTAAAQPAARYTRPSASVSPPPAIVYREENRQQRQQPTTTARRSASVSKPAKRAVQTRPAPVPQKVARPSASVKAKPAEPVKPVVEPVKEVLDMSNKVLEKPVASVKTEKKVPPLPPARSYSKSPAVTVLVKQANNELSVGKKGRAAATLERALRIAPDDPVLWLRLAEINEQQGKKSQAASMARKAMNLAPGDQNLQQRGQRLLN